MCLAYAIGILAVGTDEARTNCNEPLAWCILLYISEAKTHNNLNMPPACALPAVDIS